ncbi:MAG: DinB family protein [Gelidibacter sp.]
MNTEILNRWNAATERLIQLLSSLSEEQLNKVPFEGSWTAGQVGDHLYKSYDVMGILNGNVEDTHRDPMERLLPMEKTFKDFSIKMKSPESIVPTNQHMDKKQLLSGLKHRIERQRDAIKTMDLTKTCLDTKFPGGDTFTRQEWLSFNAMHTERHNHQLETIIEKVKP